MPGPGEGWHRQAADHRDQQQWNEQSDLQVKGYNRSKNGGVKIARPFTGKPHRRAGRHQNLPAGATQRDCPIFACINIRN